jgi:hypothetical protein
LTSLKFLEQRRIKNNIIEEEKKERIAAGDKACYKNEQDRQFVNNSGFPNLNPQFLIFVSTGFGLTRGHLQEKFSVDCCLLSGCYF